MPFGVFRRTDTIFIDRGYVRFRWRLMLALLCGAAMPFAFSPYDYRIVAVLALAGWLWLIMRERAFAIGLAFGIGWFGFGAWWLVPTFHQFGPMAYAWAVLAVVPVGVVLGLMPALWAWACQWLAAGHRLRVILLFPVLGVAEEWLRGHLLTGLPWTTLGNLLLDTRTIGWAAWLGVYGAALLPTSLAALLVLSLERRYWRFGLVGLALFSVLVWFSPSPFPANGKQYRVALIQGDIPQRLKWRPEFLNETMQRYVDASTVAATQSDVIVWPEAAVPFFLSRSPEWDAWLRQRMQSWSVPVLFGAVRLEQDGRHALNGIDLSMPGHDDREFAAKQHLVPFGEYVPTWIPFLHALVPNIGDFTPGHDSGVLQAGKNHFGSLICYEAIFPREARARVRAGANVLVNVVNDAWYGHTPATWQHLQSARMRAVETGRYLLRAANTGVSAIVAPDGRITSTIPWFTQRVLYGNYRTSTVVTPYQRWGDWPLLALLVPVLLVWRYRRRQA